MRASSPAFAQEQLLNQTVSAVGCVKERLKPYTVAYLQSSRNFARGFLVCNMHGYPRFERCDCRMRLFLNKLFRISTHRRFEPPSRRTKYCLEAAFNRQRGQNIP